MSSAVDSAHRVPTYHEQSALRHQLTATSQGLLACFSLSELQTLCFDLGVDYDELPGAEMVEKVQHLMETLQRGNHLPELLAYCREQRPAYGWPTLTNEEPAIVLAEAATATEPPPIAATPTDLLGRLAKNIEKHPVASLLYYLLVERSAQQVAQHEWLKGKKQASQQADTPVTPLDAPPATRLFVQRTEQQLVLVWPWTTRADLVALVASLGLRGNVAVSGRLFGVTLLMLIFIQIVRNFLLGDWVTTLFCFGPFVGPVSYLLLARLFNRTEITATADGLTVRHRPWPWPGNHTVLRSAIRQLYCQGSGRDYTLYALLENNPHQRILVGICSLAEALYIEQVLETTLGIQDSSITAQRL